LKKTKKAEAPSETNKKKNLFSFLKKNKNNVYSSNSSNAPKKKFFSFLKVKNKKEEKPASKVKKPEEKKLNQTISLAAAIPGKELFYIGSPVSDKLGKKFEIETLVSENPRFAFVASNDVVSDFFPTKIGSRNYVFVAAAKRNEAKELLNNFYNAGIEPLRVEAEPWAALRASWYFVKPKISKGNAEIRFLIGDSTILAILSNGTIPLAWQYHRFDSENINNILCSGFNSLQVYAHWKLKLGKIETIVLLGEKNFSEQASFLETLIGIPVVVSSDIKYDGTLVAFGLALGALKTETKHINLVRAIQKPQLLSAIFPRFEAIVTGGIVLLMLFSIWGKVDNYSRKLKRVKMENASYSWSVGKNNIVLEAEKTKLFKQIAPIGGYLGENMKWSPFLEALRELIPDNAKIIGIEAEDQIWSKTVSSKGERYFMVRATAVFPPGGKAPEEIDQCVDAIKKHPLFQKELPRVQLAEIGWKKEDQKEYAFFSILCGPKAPKKKVMMGGEENKSPEEGHSKG